MNVFTLLLLQNKNEKGQVSSIDPRHNTNPGTKYLPQVCIFKISSFSFSGIFFFLLINGSDGVSNLEYLPISRRKLSLTKN